MLILYTDLVNLVVLIPFALHIVRNMLSSEGMKNISLDIGGQIELLHVLRSKPPRSDSNQHVFCTSSSGVSKAKSNWGPTCQKQSFESASVKVIAMECGWQTPWAPSCSSSPLPPHDLNPGAKSKKEIDKGLCSTSPQV